MITEEHPRRSLTIAAVCERAECTPPTLYHHFGDLASLEYEASARAYARFSNELSTSRQQLADPKERLRHAGLAYFEWAMENPLAYRALFVGPTPQARHFQDHFGETPGLDRVLDDLSALSGKAPSDPSLKILTLCYWASVHGLACLALTFPEMIDDAREKALRVMDEAYRTTYAGVDL